MSDYLENLATKALNLIEGIQPRIASLFEPPSAAGRPMTAPLSANGEAAPDEPVVSEPSGEAPLPRQESLSEARPSRPPTMGLEHPSSNRSEKFLPPHPASFPVRERESLPGSAQEYLPGALERPAATLPQQLTGMTDTSMPQPPGQRVNRQPAPPLTPQAVDTASGQLPIQLAPHPARTIATATPAASSPPGAARPLDAKTAQPYHPDTPTFVPVIAGQETAAGPSTPTARQESLSALEHIIGRAMDERAVLFAVTQPKNITHPESVSDHARRSEASTMPVVQPHVTVYREPPASIPSEGTAMPELAPTIKITIGRVDVRAIMPATPTPRPAPKRPSPALSLEDYLQQRREGRP